MPAAEIERWCEIVAAMKVRTTNKKGRHLSTARILQLLAHHGVETPEELQKLPAGRLTASTLNRHLRRLAHDARAAGDPVSGRALERALALRHEPWSNADQSDHLRDLRS
jgi:hypothetical protein